MKPPIGIAPERIHRRQRLIELLEACARYVESESYLPKQEWLVEAAGHVDYLESTKTSQGAEQ